MKRVIFLVTVCLLGILIFAQVAFAQETTAMAGTTHLPPTGSSITGSSTLLPVAALLIGSGVLTYAVLRRR
jgi:hypothetical protein